MNLKVGDPINQVYTNLINSNPQIMSFLESDQDLYKKHLLPSEWKYLGCQKKKIIVKKELEESCSLVYILWVYRDYDIDSDDNPFKNAARRNLNS